MGSPHNSSYRTNFTVATPLSLRRFADLSLIVRPIKERPFCKLHLTKQKYLYFLPPSICQIENFFVTLHVIFAFSECLFEFEEKKLIEDD